MVLTTLGEIFMHNFLKKAHYNIIEYYRKKINLLLDHKYKLTCNSVIRISTKMDTHILKHIQLSENTILRPKKMLNSKIFNIKK